jgi:hypothetical protein
MRGMVRAPLRVTTVHRRSIAFYFPSDAEGRIIDGVFKGQIQYSGYSTGERIGCMAGRYALGLGCGTLAGMGGLAVGLGPLPGQALAVAAYMGFLCGTRTGARLIGLQFPSAAATGTVAGTSSTPAPHVSLLDAAR